MSNSSSLNLRFAATDPFVTGGQAGRATDSNGWYNHSVSVGFAGSDATSGVATCTAASYGGPDSASAAVPGTCTDRAGNTGEPLAFGLKYDESGPNVTGAIPDRQPNANGWYNNSVSFDFAGTDATSGLADCTRQTYDGPDTGAAAVTGVCRDRAGNASSRPFALKYDATPASVTGTSGWSANEAGWYNRAVLLTFNGADQTSGVDSCTSTIYNGPDTAGTSVAGTCTDRAGNRSAASGFGLKYDETAPKATGVAPARAPNAAGWYNRQVAFGFSGSDAISGVENCASPTYDGPDSAAASVSGTCTDRAGNTSSSLSFPLKYDGTVPEVTDGRAERPPTRPAGSSGRCASTSRVSTRRLGSPSVRRWSSQARMVPKPRCSGYAATVPTTPRNARSRSGSTGTPRTSWTSSSRPQIAGSS